MDLSKNKWMLVHYKYDFFAITAFIVLISVLFRNVLFKEGIIEFGDFTVPLTLENYVHFYYPLWNDFGSFSTFQYTNRLLTYGPFLLLSIFMDFDISVLVKFFALFPLVLSFISMYLASSILIKTIDGNLNNKYTVLTKFFASCVFSLNPWVIVETTHFSLIWGYAFAPLILVTFSTYLNNKYNFQFFIVPVLMTFASVTPHWVVFHGFLLVTVLLYFCVYQLSKKNYNYIIIYIKKFFIVLGIYLLLNSYWIVPFILSSRYASVSPTYIFSNEVIDMLSRNSDFINVIQLNSGWWPQVNPILPSYESIWIMSSFVLLILTVIILIIEPKNSIVNYFGFLCIIVVTLSMGSKSPFDDLYYYLSFNIPVISSQFGWVFRNPSKWVSLIALAYSFTIFLFLNNIIAKRCHDNNFKKYLISGCVVILFSFLFIFISTTIDGYSNEILNPIQIPEEYNKTNTWLAKQDGNFKTLWMPPYNGRKSTWSDGHMLGSFDTMSSSIPTFGSGNIDTAYYLYYLFNNYKTYNFSKYIAFLNIRYVIYHQDVIGGNELQEIFHDESLNKIKSYGFISIFENYEYASHINTISKNVVIIDGLDKFTSLVNINDFSPLNVSVYFPEQVIKNEFDVENSDILILKYYPNLIFVDNKYLITLFDKTTHHYPKNVWSKAATNEPLHGPWHYYLEKRGFENWDFDYGKGLVLTWARNEALDISVETEKSDEYVLLVRLFENQDGGEIKVFLDGKPITIETNAQLNKFVWKDLGTFHLDKGKHNIKLENIEGFNAVNLFYLVPKKEYLESKERTMEILQNKAIIYIFEAESDLHRKKAEKSNKFGGEASNSEVIELAKNEIVWQDVEILKEGTYRLAFKGEGKYNFTINNKSNILSSENIDLTYTTPIYLERGKHKLNITSLRNISYLDVIWLYSTDKNETLRDLFTVDDKPTEVVNYEKIDPTKYRIKVNATKPFMLSFSESFDPLWVAEAKTEDGKLMQYNPIPLYSVINGFWINQTGEYTITIRYKPQYYFYIGLIISGLAFIGCLSYLIWDWRKRAYKNMKGLSIKKGG